MSTEACGRIELDGTIPAGMGAKTVTFKLAPWTHMNPYEVLAHFDHEKWVAWMQVLSSWLWPKHSCFCVFQSHGLTLLVTRWKLTHINCQRATSFPEAGTSSGGSIPSASPTTGSQRCERYTRTYGPGVAARSTCAALRLPWTWPGREPCPSCLSVSSSWASGLGKKEDWPKNVDRVMPSGGRAIYRASTSISA